MRDESGDAIIARHLRNLAFDLNNGMSEKDALERMRERFNAEVDDDKIPFLTHRDRHFYELENRLKTATKNLKKALFATDDAEGNALALSSVKVSERATVDCLPSMMYQQLDGGDICYLSVWRNFKTAAEGFLQDKIGKCLLQGKGHVVDQLRCAIAYIRHATVTTCHDRDDFRDSFIYALWLDREATAEMNGETIDITELPKKPTSISTEDLMQMMQKVKEEAHCARVAAEAAADNTKPRKDKGGKHKHTKDGWRLQAEMVGDFSKCAFKHGGKTYGAMTEDKAKDWETRYPDANKRERKSGYYSEMRRNPDLKQEYWFAAAQWNDYWRTFKKDFAAWLKDNPKGTVDLFKATWTPPGKTVAMNPTDKTLRYGADTRFADSPDGNDI